MKTKKDKSGIDWENLAYNKTDSSIHGGSTWGEFKENKQIPATKKQLKEILELSGYDLTPYNISKAKANYLLFHLRGGGAELEMMYKGIQKHKPQKGENNG